MEQIKRKKVRKIIANCIGIFLIVSGLFSRYKKKMLLKNTITGLCFHNPKKEVFLRSIIWLQRKGCNFISSDELIKILDKKIKPPKRAIWLTFDDGWKGNMKNVIPLIKKYQIPVTFFISTGVMHPGGFFWFTFVRQYQKYLPFPYKNNVKLLWVIPESERKRIVDNLKQNIDLKLGKELNKESIDTGDLIYLSSLPTVTIGAHTVNHVITSNCTQQELNFEISQCKTDLEMWSNKMVFSFAYPNGDHSNLEKKILSQRGFTIAATTEKKFITPDTDPMLVPRFCINDDAFFFETKCQIVGAWGSLMNKIKSTII